MYNIYALYTPRVAIFDSFSSDLVLRLISVIAWINSLAKPIQYYIIPLQQFYFFGPEEYFWKKFHIIFINMVEKRFTEV